MSLDEKLEKIRSPKLQNQRETQVVLNAVEDTLRSQSYDFTATAYFAALLALLNQAISAHDVVNKELATSIVYLLDLVTSFVPAPLLRSKFSQILNGLAPVLQKKEADAPLIKSSIGCLESLLLAQDGEAWAFPQSQVGPRRALAGLLVLAQDHRPKVRKRAQESIVHVLQHPPPSPSVDHPAAEMCAETAMRGVTDILSTLSTSGQKNRKEKKQQGEEHNPGLLHALHLVKTIATASGGWPTRQIEPLCDILMQLSRSNEFLTMTAFEIFEAIFSGMTDDVASAKLPSLMRVLEDAKPSLGDEKLIPSWCAILSRAYGTAAMMEPRDTFHKLPAIYDAVKSFSADSNYNVRVSASQCLVSFLSNCVPSHVLLEPSVYDEQVMQKIARSSHDMLSMKFRSAWMEVFTVLSALFTAFKWRSSGCLDDIVKTLGQLRENEAFSGKKEADEVLNVATAHMGPSKILQILPLNLRKPRPGQPGRAWLLPILRDSVRNTHLAHFKSEMIPLSEKMFQRILDHGSSDKTMEIKIFETLVQQIWATYPGYCTLTLDISQVFDQNFAEMLSNLLYQQTDLRVDICKGLQNLVESLQVFIATECSEKDQLLNYQMSKDQARLALTHLSGFAGNLLAVLFNIYSQTLPHHRGYILQCINAYLSIATEQELLSTFERIGTLLEEAIQKGTHEQRPPNSKEDSNSPPPESHTLMDLLITMAVHLPRSTFKALFALAARVLPLKGDSQLQKKAYKLIPRLASAPTGVAALQERNVELQTLMLDTSALVSAPARRDRLVAVSVIVEHLPANDLYFVPCLLSEVVLACKEVNEKARMAAFDLLVLMGRRMASGGKVEQAKIPDMDPSAPVVEANLEEFFTMVAAGLVGSSPHMISASITALSRVLYEFTQQLSEATLQELVETISVFLTSKNREIVRSILGFAKVAITSLPDQIVKPALGALVPGLIAWSHEHKARFRQKVKNILDRAIRRFGFEDINRYCPEDDKKLLSNIRKQREKRKKKKTAQDSDEEQDPAMDSGQRPRFESEYDEALYESDSSGSLDSDLEVSAGASRRRNKARQGDAYITETGDEPLDLLDRKSLANISSNKPQPTKRLSNGKARGKLNGDGKLIINGHDDSASDDDDANDNTSRMDTQIDSNSGGGGGGVNAYVEAVSGRDAVQRGQRGRLKYNTKRQQGDEMDIDGEETADVKKSAAGSEKKVRFATKVGGGDVGGKIERDGRANTKRMRPGMTGGIDKRVRRRPLGAGKVHGGRVGKGGMRR